MPASKPKGKALTPPKPKQSWMPSGREVVGIAFGTVLGFSLAAGWDGCQRRDDRREDMQLAANVFYSQVQTNYRRLVRTNPVLRAEIRMLAIRDVHVLDASPLTPLQETSDELLVRLAPSVKSVELMNRILTVARETAVLNSQIRWRDMLRARRIETVQDATVLSRTDSLLLTNSLILMGVIEAPDTLWKNRFQIPPFD